MDRRGGKHNAYEGGVRSTAWLSGGPLDAAVVAAGGIAPSKRPDQAYYFGLMHAVDWMPTLSAGEHNLRTAFLFSLRFHTDCCCPVAGYKVAPKTAGIEIDGINHWMSIAANASSPRTSVILDIEKPSIRPMWGDVGAGVVRKGNYKLHIGDCGQLGRPGDWSRPNPDTNGACSPVASLCLGRERFV